MCNSLYSTHVVCVHTLKYNIVKSTSNYMAGKEFMTRLTKKTLNNIRAMNELISMYTSV